MIVGKGLESAAQSDKRKPPLLSPCLPKAGEKEKKGNGKKLPFTIYFTQPEKDLNLGK